MGFIFGILGSLANYLRQFGKPGITAAYVLGLVSIALLAANIFPKDLFSLEERIFYSVIGVVGATYTFIRTILSMAKVKLELFVHYPITSLAVAKNSAENIEALYIGTKKGIKSITPWSFIYPQFIALLQSSVFFDPSVAGYQSAKIWKVLGVRYKNGLFQFVPLGVLEMYDAVQFVKEHAEAGMRIDGQYESLKNTEHHFTNKSPKLLISIVVIGLILYIVGLILLYISK